MPIERAVPSTIFEAPSISIGVEVGHLDLGDLADLAAGDLADRLAAGGLCALLDARCLAQQVRRGRRLEDEAEAAVLVDRDLGRDDLAALGLRLLVVALAELDDVDAVWAERGADWRRGRGPPAGSCRVRTVRIFLPWRVERGSSS